MSMLAPLPLVGLLLAPGGSVSLSGGGQLHWDAPEGCPSGSAVGQMVDEAAATIEPLIAAAENNRLAVLTTELPDPTGYGRIIRDIDSHVKSIVEERDATDEQKSIHEINTGLMACRASLLPDRAIDWSHLGISAIVTAVVLAVGALYFRRVERTFADVV